jgi:tetratricopeptide (TPR) repeat protein
MPYSSSRFQKLLSSKYTYIVIILVISVGVYLNTLSNEFVYDDKEQVLENPWIKNIRYIPTIFFSDVWAFKGEVITNYYRPLMHIILMIDYYLFGLNPWGYHLINIIFHAGVSALVFLIASMILNYLPRREENKGEGKRYYLSPNTYNLLPAFIATLLFATHPIHTEVVAWISGIPELSFTLFYLLSFYFYIKAYGEYGKHFMLSILFFFLSTLCKETALTLPMLLLVHDYSFKKDLTLKLLPNTFNLLLKRYLPYLIVAGIYFILRAYTIGAFAPLKRHPELSNYQNIINVFPLFVQYLEKLILPINLNVYHVLHPISSMLELKGIASILLTLAFIFAVYFFKKINRVIFFSLLWIAIPLLPVLYIPVLGEASFAERYLYLPSIGFVILLAMLVAKTLEFRVFGQTALYYVITSILIMITAFYSAQTIKRNFTWKDNYTLWSNTVTKSPDGAEPHNNLGKASYDRGFIDKAMEHFQIAVGLKPDYAEAYNNLGNIYYDKRFIDKALEYFQFATRLKPNYAHAYYNIGTVYYDKGLIVTAIEQYQIAIRLKPYFPEAHYNLGIAYDDSGSLDKAAEHYQIAVKLKPYYPEARNNLGIIYARQGQMDKAIKEFSIAIQLNPYDAEAHYNLANSFYKNGQINESIKEFQTTIRLKPDHARAISKLKDIQGNMDKNYK